MRVGTRPLIDVRGWLARASSQPPSLCTAARVSFPCFGAATRVNGTLTYPTYGKWKVVNLYIEVSIVRKWPGHPLSCFTVVVSRVEHFAGSISAGGFAAPPPLARLSHTRAWSACWERVHVQQWCPAAAPTPAPRRHAPPQLYVTIAGEVTVRAAKRY